jgi:lysophospholipase L1-like esterase
MFGAVAILSLLSASTTPLVQGDRLVICGDSITEQKQYSRFMADYLLLCHPELDLDVRQLGWSGEQAPGFLGRIQSDCLRFKPTVATLCYGMNDHGYRAYEDQIGENYRKSMTSIVELFKTNGVRVLVGSAGITGKIPSWVGVKGTTVEQQNENLGRLRDIARQIAEEKGLGFSDTFATMERASVAGKSTYGGACQIAGNDGVHPGGTGHLVMAYSYLKGLGFSGKPLAIFKVDVLKKSAGASNGHRVTKFDGKTLSIVSTRYPFCTKPGTDPTNSERVALELVPFQEELGQFELQVTGIATKFVDITWGKVTRKFTAGELKAGINLAAEFPDNPFSQPFAKADEAVAALQEYETQQIKTIFRVAKPDEVAWSTERVRSALLANAKGQLRPVTHTITIQPSRS